MYFWFFFTLFRKHCLRVLAASVLHTILHIVLHTVLHAVLDSFHSKNSIPLSPSKLPQEHFKISLFLEPHTQRHTHTQPRCPLPRIRCYLLSQEGLCSCGAGGQMMKIIFWEATVRRQKMLTGPFSW